MVANVVEHYSAPDTLDDALETLAGGNVTIFCGGTDLSPQIEAGTRQYGATLMNIRRINGLAGIESKKGTLRIGALTTVTEMKRAPLLNEQARVIVEAADQFASDQIRNAASLGGNLCNASPAGDMIIPLLLLDAAVELACWRDGTLQTRLVPLDEFFTAPGTTVKRADEL
ncbi:MAG TPA: FAD binding domain-containing protein, partial [Alphaproteobacteria bacterium]|nr:FAD binding domain-containing protein [Alphaproteobacteria bacterium]